MADKKHTIEDKYVMGIDMGTTSVKVSIISADSNCVIAEHSDSTDTYVINNDTKSEQNISKIVQCLDSCMQSFSEEILKKVT